MHKGKVLIAVSMLFAGVSMSEAAIIGPDTYGYRASDEQPYRFTDISLSGTRRLAGADDSFASAPLGFSFNFYGANYETVYWSSNGLVTFNQGNSQFTNINLETTSPFYNEPSMAVLWDDWQNFQTVADATYYQTVGSPGDRRFIIQWNRTHGFLSSPSPVTFQTELLEKDGSIYFNYADVDSGDFRSNGAFATVGIRNTDGEITEEALQWSFNEASVQDGQSLFFAATNGGSEPGPSSAVPEPGTWLLFGSGLLTAWAGRRKRKHN